VTASARQTLSIEEIKAMLLARVADVAYHYAPPAQGAYEDRGRYFTLNPGRADKSVGSFYVHVSGPKAGRWQDHATAQHGDILDLIALSLGCNLSDAVREARGYLGLQTLSPDDLRRRQEAAAAAAARRQEAARAEAERAAPPGAPPGPRRCGCPARPRCAARRSPTICATGGPSTWPPSAASRARCAITRPACISTPTRTPAR